MCCSFAVDMSWKWFGSKWLIYGKEKQRIITSDYNCFSVSVLYILYLFI